MKKFLITFFILISLGGVCFFFGWVQFSIPPEPGYYGVIMSKTHGVDPQLVKAGEFRWLWYKLVPKNVKITVLRLEPSSFTINYSNMLPSGSSYASFASLGSGFSFSWDLNALISFKINPDHLVDIVNKKNITDQKALDAYIQETGRSIEGVILKFLSSPEMDTQHLEKLLSGGTDGMLISQITDLFPEIKDFSLNIQSAKFPDFILYNHVRLLYEEFLQKQREIIALGFERRSESHIDTMFHFDELERYGELLTRYPVLLDYLAITK